MGTDDARAAVDAGTADAVTSDAVTLDAVTLDAEAVDDTDHLDGNALAGALAEIFVADMTMSTFRCAGCGAVRPLPEAMAWVRGPGLVARCAGCQSVLLRVVRTRSAWHVDLSGTTDVQLPVP